MNFMFFRVRYKFWFLLMVFVLACLEGEVSPGRGGTKPSPQPNTEGLPQPSLIVDTDFDGDMKPDVVTGTVAGHGYVIHVNFTTSIPPASLTLAGGMPGMRVVTQDVNHDDDPDIIVTSYTSLVPIAVFLGDGKGHYRLDNPWNYLPVGMSPPNRLTPLSGCEGFPSNLEERRSATADLRAVIATLTLDAVGATRIQTIAPTLVYPIQVRTPRSPPLSCL